MKPLGLILLFAGFLAVTPVSAQVIAGNAARVEKSRKSNASGNADNGLFKKKKKKKDCDCPGSKQGKRKIARQRRQHTTKS